MYLFSRRARLAPGRTRDAMAWSTEITEMVNRISGLGVSLFSQVFSPELGTLVWSAFVPDLATLEAAQDKLLVDDAFIAATDAGAKMMAGGADDLLAQVVRGARDPARSYDYVSAVSTVCANGNIARGLAVGAELAERAEQITGSSTLFVAGTTGSYGSVGWLTAHDDIQGLEASQATLAADAEWLDFVDTEAGNAYVDDPSMTTSLIYRRIA